MKLAKHWQDPVNAALAAWLVVSPWALEFSDHRVASAGIIIVGVALFAAALGAILVPRAWEEWTEAALGLWLAASPWVLGFADQQRAMTNALVVGAVVLALSLWTLATDAEYRAWKRAPRAP